jgi:hypothetical protein
MNSARTTLLRILEKWASVGEDAAVAADRLQGYLSEDFDTADLANRPNQRFDLVSRALLTEDTARIVVRESTAPETPNLATMICEHDGTWRLKAFKFQCATCFGTGVDGTEPCNVCGATGWGLGNGTLVD